MIRYRSFALACGVLALSAAAVAQEFPTPGPEHAGLKALEGTWVAKMTMAAAPEAMTGEQVSSMECAGLWLVTDFKMDSPGFKFHGKGLDGYDPAKKKYVSVWVDSMVTAPMLLEGTFDEKTHTMTMLGEGKAADGKQTKYKNVTKIADKDHHTFQMFAVDATGKEKLEFTIEYSRKK